MKFLLLAIAVLLIAWRWRTARSTALRQRAQPKPPTPTALPMLVCRNCGVHIPESDAIQGVHGVYCSLSHRQRSEA